MSREAELETQVQELKKEKAELQKDFRHHLEVKCERIYSLTFALRQIETKVSGILDDIRNLSKGE